MSYKDARVEVLQGFGALPSNVSRAVAAVKQLDREMQYIREVPSAAPLADELNGGNYKIAMRVLEVESEVPRLQRAIADAKEIVGADILAAASREWNDGPKFIRGRNRTTDRPAGLARLLGR